MRPRNAPAVRQHPRPRPHPGPPRPTAPTENQPGGWKYVVETYGLAGDANFGKFKMGNEAKAVTFTVPNLWVVSRPTIDFNGSAGTIAANDFGKGDSATLFVDVAFKGKLEDMKKPDFRDEMLKALTLKGKGFIEDFKVGKGFIEEIGRAHV